MWVESNAVRVSQEPERPTHANYLYLSDPHIPYIPLLFCWAAPAHDQPYGLMDPTTPGSIWATQVSCHLVF